VAGYPLGADGTSFCEHADDNGANVVEMDRHVPPTIGCGSIHPSGHDSKPADFPRR
jgi:hypothetical protein